MATTRERGTIELRLVARAPDGEERDVLVAAAPGAPARELVAAVSAQLRVDGRVRARLAGEELPGDAPLAELALRQGDVIDLGPAHASRGPAGARYELV